MTYIFFFKWALKLLRPTSKFTIEHNSVDHVVWKDPNVSMPSMGEIRGLADKLYDLHLYERDTIEKVFVYEDAADTPSLRYGWKLNTPQGNVLLAELQTVFPDADVTNAMFISKASKSSFYPEDVITVYFYSDVFDYVKYGVDYKPTYVSIGVKYYMASNVIDVKMVDSATENYTTPYVAPRTRNNTTYVATNKLKTNVADLYLVWMEDDDWFYKQYCETRGLRYFSPLETNQHSLYALHGYGITFDTNTLEILRVKRYYS